MNIKSVNNDIQQLEKALKLVESTENYMHFKKSHLIFELCEQINVLKGKIDRQEAYLKGLKGIR